MMSHVNMSPVETVLLLLVVLLLAISAFLSRHAIHRVYCRWKLQRTRTRVRREYWGYE
jgi:hypothetical protein